jgi:polyhydroxybutyrate depolymerase
MKRRRAVVGAVLILISIPPVLALTDAVLFYVRNRNNGSIISSGLKREYLLYVPRSYDPGKPAPLVISMHGAGTWPVQQMEMTEWNQMAEKGRFIVVYPSGTGGAGPRIWHVGTGPGSVRDVRFISDLIDKLEANYNIDPARIYANGFSNGGGMSFMLSCRLSERIAAIGMVGAAQSMPWRACKNDQAVPMIDFHGTDDRFASYKGGSSWVSDVPFPDVSAFAASWARRNRCASKPVQSAVASDVMRREYTNCADNASVVLYTIHGGGHIWPGGKLLPEWFVGADTKSIDATRQMWAFFSAHPKKGGQQPPLSR